MANDPMGGREPLRLWPGVALVALQWGIWFGVPLVATGTTAAMYAAMATVLAGLGVLLWWAFFSRAHLAERLGAAALMVLGVFVASRIAHESIATAGMGVMIILYAVPVLCLAFVLWAVATRKLPDGIRRATMVGTIVVACGVWGLLRSDGVSVGSADLRWRWSASAEERLLASAGDDPATPPAGPLPVETRAEWPGFRGPHRDGVVPGVRIETDWSASPPAELWHHPVGPAWSSFAVHGDRLYTQEQRGDDEIVGCYDATTGEAVWRHRDPVRFWEANAGAGPRATPALDGGRVYALGATGILNALDAADGTRVWSRDIASDIGADVPYWGFSGSPLVVDDVVVVAAAGRLAGYDLATGEPRWSGPAGGAGYSSPHLLMLDGVAQVLLLGAEGVASVLPADGTVLWKHSWEGYPIVQPAMTDDGDVLLSASEGFGLLRVAVAGEANGWSVQERWTSRGLKPYFNDFVVHEGHAYGFDDQILACIDLQDGEREWKGGRYGNGQLVLLADQDVLLVISEEGDLALVGATPDGFRELSTFPALDDKTWNHPALVDDLLLVRNDREMVAFRLPLAGAS